MASSWDSSDLPILIFADKKPNPVLNPANSLCEAMDESKERVSLALIPRGIA